MIARGLAMGASNYLYDRDTSYLEPDRGRATDLLVAGAMATMFFTPLGGKVLGAAWKGAMSGARAMGPAAVRAGKAAYRMARNIDIKAAAMTAKKVGKAAYGGMKVTARTGAEALEFLGRNEKYLFPLAMGGVAVGGAAAAITSGGAPSGPEAYTRFEGGMPADNLGATGDLTLALHNRRR